MSSTCTVNTKSKNPFKKISVLPSFRDNMATITWEFTDSIYNNYQIKIFKSRDGYTDWYECPLENKEFGIITTASDGFYWDTSYFNLGQTYEWHYKLQLIRNCVGVESQAITARHNLSTIEFATLRQILKLEYMSPDSIKMFLCRPLSNPIKGITETTKLAPTLNPMTGQKVGVVTDMDTSYTPAEDRNVGYGKTYNGGFSKPILVYLNIKQDVKKFIDRPDGHGSIDNNIIAFKAPSYPRFIRGDMLVDPWTDNRYLFDDITSEEKFKGVIPMFFTGQMTLLSRNSEEYKYQLPECCYDILNK